MAGVSAESRGFRLVRFVARLMLRSQYRDIEVVDADRMPDTGAVLIVANHFKSIVDSMALLHASPRPASPLAKAPLWDSGLMASALDAVGAVPVYRPQDIKATGRSARANLETFESVWSRLRAGRAVAIFPEGVSQARPRLMPIRTGAARLAIGAEVPVAICPAGLVFDHPTADGRGTLLVLFGAPFVVEGTQGHDSRRAAITSVTRRTERALRELLAEATSEPELRALGTARIVWEQERAEPPAGSLAEAHERNRAFAAWLALLRDVDPDLLENVRAETETYQRALDLVGIRAETVRGRYRLGQLLRPLLVWVPLLALAWPLSVVAAFVTWPVRHVGDLIALRHMGAGADVRPFARMVGGALLLVLLMVVLGITSGVLWGPWAALAVFVGLPALLWFHIVWRDRRGEIKARLRSIALLSGPELRRDLRKQRHVVYEQLLAVEARLAEDAAPPTDEES